MVCRLSKEPGERELILLYQFQRTMIEIVKAFNWKKRMLGSLQRWMENPQNRLKDSTKNLLVFIGYLLALPADQLALHLPSKDAWKRLWFTVLEESVRRGAGNILKYCSAEEINQWIDDILFPGEHVISSFFPSHYECFTFLFSIDCSLSLSLERLSYLKMNFHFSFFW